ncbi:hypothetical protein ACFCXT_35080 [Streptomyces vinaceus]|uniref:hypothetical protein n=1 Tax=Streptomyces vinaceus TaxID=1960 RepID=UPI0035E301DD
MALVRWNGIHDAIEEHVVRSAFFRQARLLVPVGQGWVPLAPAAGRDVVRPSSTDPLLRAAFWQFVIRNSHEERAPSEDWRMYAVWLAAPGLRRTAYRTVSRLRADRKEVESVLLLGLMEEIRSCDPDRPDVGVRVLRAVHGRAWTYARSHRQETVVAEVSDARVSWDPLRDRSDGEPEAPEAVEISPLPRPEGLRAPIRFTGSATAREGERLGVLAERLGLEDVVSRAPRPGAGHRIGTLSLCAGRSDR